ncbi:MAG: hypothetical protein M3O15_01630 [Acidobacteriota bacterium]|nr:hypothetical protein [Acidobacteriota bacterium]
MTAFLRSRAFDCFDLPEHNMVTASMRSAAEREVGGIHMAFWFDKDSRLKQYKIGTELDKLLQERTGS